METNGWRLYRIAPIAERAGADDFYAPDLDSAFAQARARWPLAPALTCLGAGAAEHYFRCEDCHGDTRNEQTHRCPARRIESPYRKAVAR